MTTGEGGMVVTADDELGVAHAGRCRCTGSRRTPGSGIPATAPGTTASSPPASSTISPMSPRPWGSASCGAEEMRLERQAIAGEYRQALSSEASIELPQVLDDRIHSWHLFPIRLNLDRLTIDRNQFIDEIRRCGVGCSVHWRPLHLHPYYEETFTWRPEQLPVATASGSAWSACRCFRRCGPRNGNTLWRWFARFAPLSRHRVGRIK